MAWHAKGYWLPQATYQARAWLENYYKTRLKRMTNKQVWAVYHRTREAIEKGVEHGTRY